MENTALTTQTQAPSALAIMGQRLRVDPSKLHKTLKNTVFKKATDDELLALCVVSNEYNLNPLTKEIYAFPAKGGGITPVVSIDGWLRIINDHPKMDGMTVSLEHDERGKLVSATCSIHRNDRSNPTTITEYFAECKRNTEPWTQMPSRMLRHKAIKECGRVAFGLGGITDEDEARDTLRNVTPEPAPLKREVAVDPFEQITTEAPAPAEQVEEVLETKEVETTSDLELMPEQPFGDEPVAEVEVVEDEGYVSAMVMKVMTKTGTGKKGDWKSYNVLLAIGKEEVWASTFSDTHGQLAEENENQKVLIKTEQKGNFLNLTDIKEA